MRGEHREDEIPIIHYDPCISENNIFYGGSGEAVFMHKDLKEPEIVQFAKEGDRNRVPVPRNNENKNMLLIRTFLI